MAAAMRRRIDDSLSCRVVQHRFVAVRFHDPSRAPRSLRAVRARMRRVERDGQCSRRDPRRRDGRPRCGSRVAGRRRLGRRCVSVRRVLARSKRDARTKTVDGRVRATTASGATRRTRGGFYWGCVNNVIVAPYGHKTDCVSLYGFDPVSQKLIALIVECNGAGCTHGDPSLCIAFCCGPPTFCPAGVGAPCPLRPGRTLIRRAVVIPHSML